MANKITRNPHYPNNGTPKSDTAKAEAEHRAEVKREADRLSRTITKK